MSLITSFKKSIILLFVLLLPGCVIAPPNNNARNGNQNQFSREENNPVGFIKNLEIQGKKVDGFNPCVRSMKQNGTSFYVSAVGSGSSDRGNHFKQEGGIYKEGSCE